MFKCNNVIIFGSRYAGKSTIGKVIADLKKWDFIDLDFEIGKGINKTVAEVTNNFTEWDEFRKIELELLKNLINRENIVITCGGGVGLDDPINALGKLEKELLNKTRDNIKILCEIDTETLRNRFEKSKCSHRPRFNNAQHEIDIYRSRKPKYELLHYDIKLDSSDENIANAIKNNNLHGIIGDNVIFDKNKFLGTRIDIKEESIYKIKEITSILNLKGFFISSLHKNNISEYFDKIDINPTICNLKKP